MNSKSLFKSKTFWVNLLGITADAILHYSGVLPPAWQPYIVMAGGIINVVLRTITNQPVTLPGGGSK